MNDKYEHLRYSNCPLFADDTTLYVVGRYVRFLHTKLQNDLDNTYLWLVDKKLCLNVKKTKCVLFSKKGEINYCTKRVKLNGSEIENVSEFKFLGIWLDDHLTWSYHIGKLTNKIAQDLYLYCKLNNIIPTNIFYNVYYAHVNSYSPYGHLAEAWYHLLINTK